MVKETFYETLSKGTYSKNQFESLFFKMNEKGPRYRIILEGKSSDPANSIISGNYKIRDIMGDKDITNPRVKKDMLNLLFREI